MNTSLQLENINKSFGKTQVLHDVSFSIEQGEFCVFVGPSGCGKSTLLRIISGLEDADSGGIYIDGEKVNHLSAANRGLAMVFQSYALYPHMSVKENMSFGLENLRTPKTEIKKRVQDAAELLQIENLLQRKPGQLSGGQRQRVAIGRAIVRKPKIFLFDEPLSNLDAALRVQMRNELTQLHKELGNTMIYVTHDQVEAMTMSDRVVVLKGGIVQQMDTPLNLYNHPQNLFVAGFIGSPKMNFLPAKVIRKKTSEVQIVGGTKQTIRSQQALKVLKQAKDTSVAELTLGIRPENISIHPRRGHLFSINNIECLGGVSYLHGHIQEHPVIVHQPGQFILKPNQKLFLNFDPQNCHLFGTR